MRRSHLICLITLANFALAWMAMSDPLSIINADGIIYLKTASAYLQGGWHAAMRLYSWPFYSIFIAWVSQITHCSLELAAYFINAGLQLLICLGFFHLVGELTDFPLKVSSHPLLSFRAQRGIPCQQGDSSPQKTRLRMTARGDEQLPLDNTSLLQLLAALVILCYPAFNHHRDLIIRDFGYWAFSLWGWYYLIRLNKSHYFLAGVQFTGAMLLASLFRLEGVIMWLIAPFFIFIVDQRPLRLRISIFLKSYALTMGLFIMGLLFFSFYSHEFINFGRLIEFKTQLYLGVQLIGDGLATAKQQIASEVLTFMSVDSALPLLTGGLIAVYLHVLLMTLTPLYTGLLGLAIGKKPFSFTSEGRSVIYTAILLNFFITVVFLLQTLFLTQRYLFGLCFLLLLWIPFGLLWLYRQKLRLFIGVIIVMISIAFISLHHFGPSKIYIKQAANWMDQHLPDQGRWYTNSAQLGFYSHRSGVTWQAGGYNESIDRGRQALASGDYAYLAIQMNESDKKLKTVLQQEFPPPIKIMMNERGDAVWIFHLIGKSHG